MNILTEVRALYPISCESTGQKEKKNEKKKTQAWKNSII